MISLNFLYTEYTDNTEKGLNTKVTKEHEGKSFFVFFLERLCGLRV